MEYENLLKKAKDNYYIAKYSENKELYDVAVSRYYYYIFQNLLVFIKNKYPDFKENKDKGSHIHLINFFSEKFLELGFNFHEMTVISDINKLKFARTLSDYKDFKIESKAKFDSNFKDNFDIIEKTLKNKKIIP